MSLSVALSRAQQYAVLGYALTIEDFYLKAVEHIDPQWFDDLYMMTVFKQLKEFYGKYKMLPRSEMELLSEPFFRSQSPNDLKVYVETINYAKAYTQNFTLEVIRNHLSNFVRTVTARSLAKKLVIDMNRENYDEAVKAADRIAQSWREINFDPPKSIDFNDVVNIWMSHEDGVSSRALSTGCKNLDELLGGGLEPGGNLAVLAPTFTGKSRFLITLLRHLLVQGKRVLFLLHEDSPVKVKERIISAMVGIGPKELRFVLRREYITLFSTATPDADRIAFLEKLAWRNPHLSIEEWDQYRLFVIQQLEAAKQILQNQLFFVVWQKAGQMFVEDVLAEIKRVQNECRARFGQGLDAIIDDYPALLRSRNRHEHERARLSYVYQCFNDVAAELGAFCAYAVQVNRHAAKAIKTGEADHAIGLEDVSESYQIAMNAMSAISLNRSNADAQRKVLRIAIIKARDAQAQSMLITRTAYNEGSLYGDAQMYTGVGQMMIEGLASYKSNGYDLLATDGVHRALEDAELKLSQGERIIRSQAPILVKKLLGWDEQSLLPATRFLLKSHDTVKEKEGSNANTEQSGNNNSSQ